MMRFFKVIHKILKTYGKLLKDSFLHFLEYESMVHAAAMSYYSLFAIPAALFLLLYILGHWIDEQYMHMYVSDKLGGTFGAGFGDFLFQWVEMRNFVHHSWYVQLVGFVIVLFTSSTLFSTLQRSLNVFWKAKGVMRKGFVAFVINKLKAFAMISFLGAILLVSLVLDYGLQYFKEALIDFFGKGGLIEYLNFNWISILFINTLFFTIIFKFLANAKAAWKVTIVGALVTAVLFSIGNTVISVYLVKIDFSQTFGIIGSIMMLLTWVYYSSVIMFFGAHFTYKYALLIQKPIQAIAPQRKHYKEYTKEIID